eukprot:5101771-Pyramimonas_sp.AAC.1
MSSGRSLIQILKPTSSGMGWRNGGSWGGARARAHLHGVVWLHPLPSASRITASRASPWPSTLSARCRW